MDKIIKTGVSSAIKIDEYNGSINLVAGYMDKEGAFKMNWGTFEVYDKATKTKVDKKLPLKLYLGNKERAVEVLSALVFELSGAQPKEEEADTPF